MIDYSYGQKDEYSKIEPNTLIPTAYAVSVGDLSYNAGNARFSSDVNIGDIFTLTGYSYPKPSAVENASSTGAYPRVCGVMGVLRRVVYLHLQHQFLIGLLVEVDHNQDMLLSLHQMVQIIQLKSLGILISSHQQVKVGLEQV